MGAATIHADVVSSGMCRALGIQPLVKNLGGAGSEKMVPFAWAKYARERGAGLGMRLVGLTLFPVGKPSPLAKN